MENLIDYRLDNGMKVLLLPSKSAPVVACNVWVGVGSADETPEEAGLAHVHEHMLFKGTEKRGVGQIAKEVEAAGGHINAFTSFDQTCYYVVMSSRYLETGLDILSDAIRRSSFDAEELSRELEVIQEEIKRGMDSPSRVASLKLFETAYDVHPYRLPVIGTKESVDSFRRQNVLDFFHKHYVPSNMTVVLAGDFELEQAKDYVERFFGDFEGAGYERVVRPSEPRQQGMKVSVAAEGAQDTHLRIGFHIPDAVHEDIPAIELLATIMGQGEASHLYQKIQYEKELVNGVYAGSYTPRDNGLFMVSADYQLVEEGSEEPGARTHQEVVGALMAEVFRFCQVEPTAAELARARTIIESQAVYSKQTVEGLAMKIGQYDMVTGSPRYEEEYYVQLAKVNTDDLLAVAKRYLTPENMSLVLSYPPETPEALIPSADAIEAVVREQYAASHTLPEAPDDRSREAVAAELAPPAEEPVKKSVHPPRSLPAPDAHGFIVEKLESGPTLLIQENHAVELFSVRALVMGGLRMETPENNGVSAMLAELVTRGTSKRDALQIAHDMESMAASVAGITGRNTFGMSLTSLSKFFDPALDLFAECLLDATIPEEEFERMRRLQIQEIRSRTDQLGAVNYDQFAATFFAGHPYALPTVGTAQSLSQLTPEQVRSYLEATIDPRQLVISVVGDVNVQHCVERFEAMFAGVRVPQGALTGPSQGIDQARERLVTADLDKNQAHVIVGFDAPRVGSEERYALEILHSVLSGQGGRLFYELRDKQSLAYSVYASMLLGVEASTFMINIGTSPEKIDQALRGMVGEVERLKREPPTEQEIEDAKRYLIGNHDIGLQRNSARAMSVALDELYGLGHARSFDYGDRIAAVTAEEINALIAKYLRVEDAVVAITKPGSVKVEQTTIAELFGA